MVLDGIETKGEVMVSVCKGGLVLGKAADGLFQAVGSLGTCMVFGHGVAGRQVGPMMGNILRIRDRKGVSVKKAIKREREGK